MCADKAKEKAANQQPSPNTPAPVNKESDESGNEFFVGGPKTDSDAAGKLRRLFSTRETTGGKADGTEAPSGQEQGQKPDPDDTAPRLPALKMPIKQPNPNETVQQLPALTKAGIAEANAKSTSAEKAAQDAKNQGRAAAKMTKSAVKPVTSRTMDGASKSASFKLKSGKEALLKFKAKPAAKIVPARRRIPENYLELDIKNFKGHIFLRKDSMQEFAYRIKEVSRDWDDFKFVDPADDIEWHRSSINQALNDFATGLALPTVRLALEDKARDGMEPQYDMGNGVILVRPDDIRNAPNVDVGAIYHELMHAEQDALIIRRIALAATLNKPLALNSAEIMFEYCGQTGFEPGDVSRDWIHSVLQASTDWLKRKSDEIKKVLKKHPSMAYEEAFMRDRELVRAKELTASVQERVLMHKHLTRKHQLLVHMHRQFTQNIEPHVYIEKFDNTINFQRVVLGYDWNDNQRIHPDEEFVELIESKPEFVQIVLFGVIEDWLALLPRHYRGLSIDRIARLKIRALLCAYQADVTDSTDAELIKKFDQKYREATRKILVEIQDDFAEQIRLKRIRHYLGVELELEANHAAHIMNKLHGQDRIAILDRGDDSQDDFISSLTELNENLPMPRPEHVPELPSHEDQAAVIVHTGNAERTTPDIVIAKNRRVIYRGSTWTVSDFNPDTGDVVLIHSAEKSIPSADVFTNDKPLSINESFRIKTEDGRLDDGWIYRGRGESGNLIMFKPNAERIEVPKLALISVNQLLANARAAQGVSDSHLPRIDTMPKGTAMPLSVPGKQEMSWAGSHLGSFLIEDLLSDRQFYWIYSGSDQSTFEKKVFKVAKPLEYLTNLESIDPLKSTVLKLSSTGFSTVAPNVSELLKLQCERMRYDTEHVMAKIEEVICTDALCYSRMEYIDGVTLRELRKHGPLTLDLALDIVNALDIIQNNPALRYHGDLTPDNIMTSYSSVKLLDAGYFGSLDCMEGMVEDAAITTPAYYPFLTPNDMLAVGIIFWEMHFGKNPFSSYDETPAAPGGVSQALVRILKGYSSIGRPFVNSMARLFLPRSVEAGIHPELERFLLASLGLRINEANELDASARFETFAQMAEALRVLQSHGITEL